MISYLITEDNVPYYIEDSKIDRRIYTVRISTKNGFHSLFSISDHYFSLTHGDDYYLKNKEYKFFSCLESAVEYSNNQKKEYPDYENLLNISELIDFLYDYNNEGYLTDLYQVELTLAISKKFNINKK